MSLAPIILFVYKRPYHTKRTVELLKNNIHANESELYIYSDAAKSSEEKEKVLEVRKYIANITGFKKKYIINREENYGLSKSIISGVSDVIEIHKKVIVLEDDILTSRDFLKFINEALKFYQDNVNIFSISGYTFPIKIPNYYDNDIFIIPRVSSWGWGTWIDRWKKVDWNIKDFNFFKDNRKIQKEFNIGGEDLTSMLLAQRYGYIDSWAIRWNYAQYKNDAVSLFPVKSKIQNIGFDNSGTHIFRKNKFSTNFNPAITEINLTNEIKIDNNVLLEIKKLFKQSLIRKFINYFRFYIQN